MPTIVSLQEKAESIIQTELKKSGPSLSGLTADQEKAVQTLMHSIAEKMLNDPILYLKNSSDRITLNNFLDMTRKLFNLDQEDEDKE